VTVYTRREVRARGFFFGTVPFLQKGAGSGFVISPDGYILTNNHVVAGSDSIKVVLGVKQKKEYDAVLVGTDPDTDVALIKIEEGGLPSLPLGDSDSLRVGDWVAAIGSPFNFPHTFTVGVVSAKGRRLGLGNYDDFIQTDASINSGNSGGPLINMQGHVVGINTMIISPSGGNVGIGFSIPINLVKMILPQLKESGKITRSWLGVRIEQVTPEMAEAAGLPRPYGAHVTLVVIGSPAEKAGIGVGDIIVEFDGRRIEDSRELPALVSSYGVGKTAKVSWLHNGDAVTGQVLLEKLPERKELEKREVLGSANVDNILGVGVRDLNDEDREAMGLGDLEGVLVVQVAAGGPAEGNDIQTGDVITKINMVATRSVADFERAVQNLRNGSYVRINMRRDTATILRVFRIQQ
jgi:serine protease Do